MGLFDTTNYALRGFSYGNYSYTPSSYSFGYSAPSYSSYPLLFSFNYGYRSFAPSTYSPKSFSYSSFAPSRYSAPKYSGSTNKFGSLTFPRSTGALQTDLVNNALSWVGKVNSDREGNSLFSNGISQAWCADFVTFNTKETFGSKLPTSFGSSSVSGLMNWGKQNDCYLDVASASNKSQYIAQNVKPGDIMIEKRGGKSHTGIVTKVNSDGSFETVEGNTSNKVATRKYTASSSTLSGFVSLDRYAA